MLMEFTQRKRPLIEICCCSTDDAMQAYLGGADRIELNSCLEAGGLTPSIGSLKLVKQKVHLPVIAMIRPRTGGFCYTSLEFETMKQDAHALLQAGADGIAVGILNEDGSIDVDRMQEMLLICKEYRKEAVCHRAIDVTPDPIAAAELIVSLGFNRILTSGGRQRCFEGIDTINEMWSRFGNQIEILACGSIRPNNLAEIISKTNVNQFHMALMKTICDPSMTGQTIHFNGTPSELSYTQIDQQAVREAVRIYVIKEQAGASSLFR